MAKAYTVPAGYEFELDFSNLSNWQKDEEDYLARLKKWVKENTDSKNPLVGEIWKTGVADGYAVYMVYRTKPLELLHVPVGDAWQAPEAHINGLRLSDIKKSVEADKAIAKIFRKGCQPNEA